MTKSVELRFKQPFDIGPDEWASKMVCPYCPTGLWVIRPIKRPEFWEEEWHPTLNCPGCGHPITIEVHTQVE